MTDRPILFNDEDVRAILDGRKVQTRRVVKPQPTECGLLFREWEGFYAWEDDGLNLDEGAQRLCPYGAPGDRLWVRETIRAKYDTESYATADTGRTIDGVYYGMASATSRDWVYAADGEWINDQPQEWVPPEHETIPSIHMPRWASRLTLEVVSVRVERVQEISEEDAIAEGIQPCGAGWENYLWHGGGAPASLQDAWDWQYSNYVEGEHGGAKGSFSSLWQLINAKRGFGWDANPFVWVVEFKRV